MDYKKIKENIVTVMILLTSLAMTGLIEIYGKGYFEPIWIVVFIVIVIFGLLYVANVFLEKREERWIKNKEEHDLFEGRLSYLEKVKKEILQSQKIYTNINKLENRISYIEGRRKK